MYHKTLTQCFPYSELPTLYECIHDPCFYRDTLLNHREVVWKNRWNGAAVCLEAFCPSCDNQLVDYEDPDGTTN